MSRLVCARCVRPQTHCLCSLIPSLESRSRVLILQHPGEVGHAMNTAGLAVLGLRGAKLRVGERFDPADWDLPGYAPRLLFPGAQAQVLREEASLVGGRYLLVVLDGTWSHARKLLRDNPALAQLERFALPDSLPARYRIRHADTHGALSTVEAVTYALNVLEAPARFDALLRPFDALIEGQIAAMGREKFEQHHVARQGSRQMRQVKK